MFLQHGNSQIQWEIKFMKMIDSIDFVTVAYKRLDYVKLIHESIKKYVDHPYTYYIVNNGNNADNSPELLELYDMFKDEPNVKVVKGVQQVNDDDGNIVPAREDGMHGKYSQQYFIDNYGFDGYSKYDQRELGFASWLQSEGMTIGVKQGNGKYICHIEHDCIFLNTWVNELLPKLKDNVFISYQWRHDIDQALTPQFGLMERETIENNYFREEGDLYPNCHYKDTYGLISLWARETNKPFYICKNSTEDISLRAHHVLNIHGDEGFINEKPFIHHAGRGAARTDDYYHNWITEVSQYLDITI